MGRKEWGARGGGGGGIRGASGTRDGSGDPQTLLQGACSTPASPEARAGHPTPYLAVWAHPPGEAAGTPDGTPLPWPLVPRRGQVNLLSRKISALSDPGR